MTEKHPGENRSRERNTCYAKIIAGGVPGYLRNISQNGAGVEFLLPPDLKPGEKLVLTVNCQEETGLKPFEFAAEVEWIRPSKPYFDVGFSGSPVGEHGKQTMLQLISLYSK